MDKKRPGRDADFVKLTSDLRNETTNRMNEASEMKKAKAHQDSVIKQLASLIEKNKQTIEEMNNVKLEKVVPTRTYKT